MKWIHCGKQTCAAHSSPESENGECTNFHKMPCSDTVSEKKKQSSNKITITSNVHFHKYTCSSSSSRCRRHCRESLDVCARMGFVCRTHVCKSEHCHLMVMLWRAPHRMCMLTAQARSTSILLDVRAVRSAWFGCE